MPVTLRAYLLAEASAAVHALGERLEHTRPPDPDGLLRLAALVGTGIRMAGSSAPAALADDFEERIRAFSTGALPWSEEVRAEFLAMLDSIEAELDPARSAPPAAVVEQGGEGSVSLAPIAPGEEQPSGEIGAIRTVPIGTLPQEPPGPGPEAPTPEEVLPIVPISALCLRGTRALEEAWALRSRAAPFLPGGPGAHEPAGVLIQELFELIELALVPERSAR